MSSRERKPSDYLTRPLLLTVVPLTVAIMIVTTAVTGFQSIVTVKELVGDDTLPTVIRHFGINIATTILAEFVALCVTVVCILRLKRKTGRLADEMQQLTRSVLHDLNTPLAHIQQTAEALHKGQLDAENAALDISESCRSIATVVDMNAEISKTYEGLDRDGATSVDLCDCVRRAAGIFSAVAEDEGLTLTCNIPETPVLLTAHPHRIHRLIGNLLDNAVKFTPRGGRVTITLSATSSSATLTVTDTGIGMTADQKARIFERFYRANTAAPKRGFGLGLSLVHAIVTFYNGTITVESSPGNGTSFKIALPTNFFTIP